jgi:hypothetical protein
MTGSHTLGCTSTTRQIIIAAVRGSASCNSNRKNNHTTSAWIAMFARRSGSRCTPNKRACSQMLSIGSGWYS